MKNKNEYYKKLNARFDFRVLTLTSMGYKYYKEHVCFSKSEMTAKNYGISNSVIMHCDDYHFNNIINN